MREIEIRRHSCTRKGIGQGRGSHLSPEGVHLAREIGMHMGKFDLVLTSEEPRTLETAIAMGFAVDGRFSIPLDIRTPALATLGHHERWSWDAPWVRFAKMVQAGGPVARFGAWLRAAWVHALESTGDGGRVLVISHGRHIEAGVVACLGDTAPPDFAHWGEPLHQCEGVKLSYAQGRFTDPRLIRTRRCAEAYAPGTSRHVADVNAATKVGGTMPTDAASAPLELEDWFVFETFGADGTLAIGVARGVPDPSMGMVIRDGLTRKAAGEVASRLAAEYRAAGRPLDPANEWEMPVDWGDGW